MELMYAANLVHSSFCIEKNGFKNMPTRTEVAENKRSKPKQIVGMDF